MKMQVNLNEVVIDNDGNYPLVGIQDNSISSKGTDIQVFFRNQKNNLIQKIESSDTVIGCVAWLTDFDILKALGKVDTVAIVIQKEDFLRPDIGATNNWKKDLRSAYSNLKNNTTRYEWPGLIEHLSVCHDPQMKAVRCVGNHNKEKKPAFPRMHNKFLVFGNSEMLFNEVWTGSFNLTMNANMSFENSILIKSKEIADAYYKEFSQIYALSEPLDWTNDWVAPELRIGT